MPLKDRYLGTVLRIPQAGGFVVRGGDDASAIGAEGGHQDRAFMSAQNGQFRSGLGIPDTCRRIARYRNKPAAVRAERHLQDAVLVTTQNGDLAVGGYRVIERCLGVEDVGAVGLLMSSGNASKASRIPLVALPDAVC
jgi:hypothetical protein